MKERFIQFLMDEGVYDAFILNLKRDHLLEPTLETYLDTIQPGSINNLVACAFRWQPTKEEHAYWKAIDAKWQAFCGVHNTNLINYALP